MKRRATLDALIALDPAALTSKIRTLERSRDRARLDAGFGSVKNHQALQTLRREIAQAKTIAHQRVIGLTHSLRTQESR